MSTLNPFSPDFQLSVCNGPEAAGHIGPGGVIDPAKYPLQANYTPCDFAGLMTQAQFLINAMIMLGVVFAVVSFSYAGYLYITGAPKNIDRAKDIFKKVGIGFIMMLTAWFVVFQILDWLAGNPGVKALLGQ